MLGSCSNLEGHVSEDNRAAEEEEGQLKQNGRDGREKISGASRQCDLQVERKETLMRLGSLRGGFVGGKAGICVVIT